MKKIIYLLLLSSCYLSAQSTITGVVLDNNSMPIPFADILLVLDDGSSTSDRTISDENGVFLLKTNETGRISIQVISMGFEPYTIENIVASRQSINLGELKLSEATFSLEDVNVTAKKIPFKREIDRAVIDLEDDASTSGSSLLDILERTPGIVVDRQNESIAMLGKSGVNVMINGKMSYMPASALVQYLNGLNAENAKSIELITTPPAQFDAEGNAGFINIVLKKSLEDGYNGNFNTSLATGDRKTSENGNLNFNVNSNRSKLAFNYSVLNSDLPISFSMTRNLVLNQIPTETYFFAKRDNTRVVQNLRFGYDYQVSEKLSLGITVAGYSNAYKMIENKDVRQSDQPNFNDNYYTTEDNYWKSAQMGLNASYEWSEKSKISFISDYLEYSNDQPVFYSIDLNSPQETERIELQTTKNSPFTILANTVDYETTLDNNTKISLGLKQVENKYQNKTNLFRNQLIDEIFSTDSELDEKIFAAYAQVKINPSDQLGIQAGFRYEDAKTKINSNLTNENLVNRNNGDFFPSVFLSYKINDFNNLNMSVNRRINRPAFTDMAPFVFFVDLDQAFNGNVELKPSYTNNFQIDYRYKSVSLNLQYADETDLIARFQPQVDEETGFITVTPRNIDRQKTLTAILSYSFFPSNFWSVRMFSTVSNINILNNNELGVYDFNAMSYRLNVNNSFTLPNDYSFQIWGYYNSKSFFGVSTLKPNGSLNLGIQKKFNAFSIALNADNILDTQKWRFITENPDANYEQRMTWDFRPPQLKLSLTYNFGNDQLKVKKIRESEESKRMSL